MKNKKSIFVCVLSGILVFSNSLSAYAAYGSDISELKSGLLLEQKNNYSYNIRNYDTNNDNVVNVLDLCRLKNNMINTDTEKVSFAFGNPEIPYSKSKVTIPVYVLNSSQGFSAVQMDISYNEQFFKLKNVRKGDFSGSVATSRDKKTIQFLESRADNITYSGTLVYLEFEPAAEVPYNTYSFYLNNISAATLTKDGTSRTLTARECPVSSEQLNMDFWRTAPAVTTPTTSFTTTTTPVTTTTTPITTTTTTPVTTTTTPITTTTTTPISQEDNSSSDNQWLLSEINKYRSSIGKRQMTLNEDACKAAYERAIMLSQSYSKDLPDGSNFKYILYSYDVYPYCISQNIDTSSTKEGVLNQYLTKAATALNDDKYNKLGIGHYISESGAHYWAIFTYG